MTTPLPGSGPQVLMVALTLIQQSNQAGPLPQVPAGQAFWADASQAAELAAGGLAELAPPGTTAPPLVRPYTVNGVPGLAAGTSNASPG